MWVDPSSKRLYRPATDDYGSAGSCCSYMGKPLPRLLPGAYAEITDGLISIQFRGQSIKLTEATGIEFPSDELLAKVILIAG